MLAFYKKSLFAAFLMVFYIAFGLSASAQSGGSSTSVTGTVVDPTGAVVPNATVEIRNPVSGFTRTATTDSSGENSASPTFHSILITFPSLARVLHLMRRMLMFDRLFPWPST